MEWIIIERVRDPFSLPYAQIIDPPQSENVFTEIPTSGTPDTALYNALGSTEGISNQDYSGFGGRKVKPLVFMYLHLCGFWKHWANESGGKWVWM